MIKGRHHFLVYIITIAILGSCGRDQSDVRVAGILERDRIELVAEAHEPIIDIVVREGDHVAKNDLVLRLDGTVLSAQLNQVSAARDRASARYDELVRGPRVERIDAARARLKGAEDSFTEAEREFARAEELLKEGTVSQSDYDLALRQLNESKARHDEAKAQYAELLEGTTPEELAQAKASLAEAEAVVVAAQTRRDRLSVRAPQDGVIDALPFELGERPLAGAVVAVMLADGAPYVRCFISVEVRPFIRAGVKAWVYIQGIDDALPARVRFVSSEAAFTPFFALTEHDRGRLSYLAEVDLLGDQLDRLPTGVPVEVSFDLESQIEETVTGDLISRSNDR